MKDIFYFWDIATFFPSVFFFLKEPWFFESHPFHWRNYETMDTWSPTRSLTRASDCQQKCSENDPFQRLHTYVTIIGPHIE